MPWLKKRLDSLVDRKPGEEIQYVKSKTDHYGQQMPVRIFQKGAGIHRGGFVSAAMT